MSDPKTKEPQYQFLLDQQQREGLERFGLMSSQVWRDDPRRLLFVLARYKFVSKMFSGLSHVLEVGCADAFGTRVVLQEVKALTAMISTRSLWPRSTRTRAPAGRSSAWSTT